MTMRESRVLEFSAVVAPIIGVLEPLGLARLLAVAAFVFCLVHGHDRQRFAGTMGHGTPRPALRQAH